MSSTSRTRNKSLGSGATPKAATQKGPSNGKVDRKKAQNRISQQCLREKQLATTKHMNSMLNALQGSRASSKDDRQDDGALLESHLELIEQNKRLIEAVLRLRKKLLLLSASANAAAGTLF